MGADDDPFMRVRQSFAAQPLMTTLGARLAEVSAGRVVIEADDAPEIRQQHGYVHGGTQMALADTACGYAAMSVVAANQEVLTIECKTNFLRPAQGRLVAEGRVVRAGRSVTVCAAEVYAGEERRHVATTLATLAIVDGNPAG